MLGLTLLLASFLGIQQSAPAPPPLSVSGKVTDRSGRALSGVTVKIEHPGASQAVLVATDAGGAYWSNVVWCTAPQSTPEMAALCTITFELPGFETYRRTRLTLPAGQTRTLNVALENSPYLSLDPDPVTPPPPASALMSGEIAIGIETSLGTFYIAVDTKRAPATAANFLRYVDARLYDRGRFHRATRPDNYTPAPPNRPMMNIIQGGIDPTKRNEGFPAIPLERTSVTGIKHVTGVVSMARGTPDSATSDFFVLLDDQPSLDHGGMRFDDGQGGGAFGRVLSGLDVVKKIQQQPVDGQNLSGPVTIRRVWRVGR